VSTGWGGPRSSRCSNSGDLGPAAGAHGNTDVSQGIDWVVQHAHDPGLNVRVLNLSFGTNSNQAYTLDPRAGLRVVTLPRPIADLLAAHLAEHVPSEPQALILTGDKGAAMRRSNFNRTASWPNASRP
jgi:hypothetical protein